jgi:hypothetical protein
MYACMYICLRWDDPRKYVGWQAIDLCVGMNVSQAPKIMHAHMFVCVCMCVCTCVCMYACMHVDGQPINMCMGIHVCMYHLHVQ